MTLADRFFANAEGQVWALDRATGDTRFLEDGTATEMRATVREQWRCPWPDCLGEITTVSGSNRHHWRHLDGNPHKSAPESEDHLAAKAMLAAWARRQAPKATVREEGTLKEPATRFHRRADVLVTWPEGQQVALEVEYKAFVTADWGRKQDAYTAQGIVCSWAFGHRGKHVTLRRIDSVVRVSLREPAPHVAAAGLPVLVVHPDHQLVGTVVVDGTPEGKGQWWDPANLPGVGVRLPGEGDTKGRLVIEELDACRLDRDRGIVTPAMEQVWADREALTARAAEAAKAYREEQERRLQESRMPLRSVGAGRSPFVPAKGYHCYQCQFRDLVGKN